MALPIGATPVLTGEEAIKFIMMVHDNAKKPASLTPTPKLEEARELVEKHAKCRQKRVH